ncbi:MAG: hypothetical protein AAGA48_18125 [Myxococcota bacterium]
MGRWAIGIAWFGIACVVKDGATEALVEPDEATAVRARGPAEERGLDRASAVPLRGGYENVPKQWDKAKIFLDDKPAAGARACLYDANTILAQFSHGEAETIYTVTLQHPPMMTASSEGMSDEANWMRMESRDDMALYEAKFGKDRDDFRSKRVKIEAPADLRPCR